MWSLLQLHMLSPGVLRHGGIDVGFLSFQICIFQTLFVRCRPPAGRLLLYSRGSSSHAVFPDSQYSPISTR